MSASTGKLHGLTYSYHKRQPDREVALRRPKSRKGPRRETRTGHLSAAPGARRFNRWDGCAFPLSQTLYVAGGRALYRDATQPAAP